MSYTEIEATLAICSEEPEQIANDVAHLPDIGQYRLTPRSDLAIRDIYMDLTDHSLRSLGFGLRLRLVAGSQLITLKGKAEEVVGGGRRREEIELDWSADALAQILDRVAANGLEVEPPPLGVDWNNPSAVLFQMGFFAEQTRDTRRRPRDVSLAGTSESVLAELVVDSVSYQFKFGVVRHHEVEIEVKGEGGVAAMQSIADGLLSRWPSHLRVWDYGKRSTGRAVEALIAEHGTQGITADTGDLTPEAYELIASAR